MHPSSSRLCPHCGFQNPRPYNFCTECGKKLHSGPQAAQQAELYVYVLAPLHETDEAHSRKSRGVYIALCLFLGWLGIHNIYARRTRYGVAQLLITVSTFWLIYPVLAVSLWAIFEIFNVSTDGNGMKMR